MKKQMRLVGTAAMIGALLGGASSVAATTFNGEPNGNIPVTGRVGLDNTVDPGVNPPTNPDEMINVTVPTSAVFFTTGASGHTEVQSPVYSVTNNSAWDVNINITSLANPTNLSSLSVLELDVEDQSDNVRIVTSGSALSAPASFMSLTKNVAEGGTAPTKEFGFVGTAIPNSNIADVITPTFDMVLQFQAVVPAP
ncbi:hypothetical protein [Enterococcus mundtii]|uniref:WxL domain-containing protein n=1 Tax=Enterococcus mundtii TaxID=53346 RepID=A0A2S7RWU3_ENTMU|nr:hypothetical protein [Enterococcus mundtii]MDA9460948.1 Endo-1, 4-beta-xylanase A precursor [Enterococcus mundtii 3F]OBS62213.1 hypothetical protein AX758_02035 [Enterococcus mundtii]PQF24454.1 hypothetical protein CUS89_04065 [Enterococcus mundtii]PTO36755.1 hypothetical protein C6P52_13595 [Enterococcus mundtii]PTO40906.1 hypothetical protein C6P54_14165 [Enterococcus mundtii]